MSANPRVFVVMPSYNQGRFIRQAVDSVLGQGYEPLSLQVMDGGSTDGTLDVLRSYGERLTFVSARDRGQSDALNRGFARADGEIVCWLNSDDAFLPGALAAVADAFRRHPEAEFVYGKGWDIDERGRILRDSGVRPFNLWKLIHHRNFIHQPSCFFRKGLLDRVGAISEDLHYVMDWELWIRFAAYPGVFVDEFLSCNRTYAQNKTQSGTFRRWREIRRMVRLYTDEPLPPVLWLYFLESVIHWLRQRPLIRRAARPLERVFRGGILKEQSGVHADGSFEPAFAFTVPNPGRKDRVRLTLTPVSRYDPAALGGPPVRVVWRSGRRRTGTFELLETGGEQEVVLPLDPTAPGVFAHFTCRASAAGRVITPSPDLPGRRVVGFLDRIAVAG
jgi:glycosyltransferase involved in cell wall biosynthesis